MNSFNSFNFSSIIPGHVLTQSKYWRLLSICADNENVVKRKGGHFLWNTWSSISFVLKFISAVFLTTGSKLTILVARSKSGLDAVGHSLVSQIANIPLAVSTDPCIGICFRHCWYSSALIQSIHWVLRTTSLDFQCPVRNDLIQLQCIRQIIIFRQLVRSSTCCLRVRRSVGMEPAFKRLGPCFLLVFLIHFSWKWS